MTVVRRLAYTPALDGVRGVAVLVVVSGHFFAWPNAHLGVEIFFVLSGFLITVLLLQERAETGSISLRSFYRRRALRLMPALLVALAGFLALSAALTLGGADVPTMNAAVAGATYSALYIANFVQAFGHPLPPGLLHTWSLAIEEQFYVVWPLALLLMLRLRASWRAITVALGVAIAFVVIHRLHLQLAGASPARIGFAPDTRSDSLLIGCLFGVAFHAGVCGALGSATLRRWLGLTAGITVAIVAVLSPSPQTLSFGLWPLFGIAVALIVFRSAADPDSRTARALSARPLLYVGRISYGLYLWHLILLWTPPESVGVPGGMRIAAAFVAAALSHRYVETPFLRRKRTLRDPLQSSSQPVPEPAPAAA